MEVESIGNPICHLAECPIWSDADKALYWTDILEGQIWKYDPQSAAVEVVWQDDFLIGGFAFTRTNDIVLCANKGVYLLPGHPAADGISGLKMLFDIPMAPDERFNDITTDPAGRIFAGTLTKRRVEGTLYRLEKGKSPVPVVRDIGTSNGMTFSLDLKQFYHTDSHAKTITRYDYDLDTGDIENGQVIYRGADGDGAPDGITMDTEGFIWVACWGGSKVVRIDSQGAIVRRLAVPAIQTSSVIFGGDGMNQLYITTACEHGADLTRGLDEQGRYLGGEVFHAGLDIVGRKEWPADF